LKALTASSFMNKKILGYAWKKGAHILVFNQAAGGFMDSWIMAKNIT
jgi:hypothetical protein